MYAPSVGFVAYADIETLSRAVDRWRGDYAVGGAAAGCARQASLPKNSSGWLLIAIVRCDGGHVTGRAGSDHDVVSLRAACRVDRDATHEQRRREQACGHVARSTQRGRVPQMYEVTGAQARRRQTTLGIEPAAARAVAMER